MPVALSRNDRGMPCRIEIGLDPFLGLQGDITLDGLTFTVLPVKVRGNPSSHVGIVGEEKGESLGGAPEATGGIDAARARQYLALANVTCVGGSWMVPKALVEAGDYEAISQLAAAASSL